ncbi:unnamed protein product [Toxocara canis]|uniref:RuBisCO_large domain-containing protein n=1 Tax=Toxocara canis TaxID=6265 RepID=A0A183TXA1_TOXCA|nr:unnamed protein product [Toxocara canis]
MFAPGEVDVIEAKVGLRCPIGTLRLANVAVLRAFAYNICVCMMLHGAHGELVVHEGDYAQIHVCVIGTMCARSGVDVIHANAGLMCPSEVRSSGGMDSEMYAERIFS